MLLVNDMNYFYSAITNSFYPEALKEDYTDSGTWPLDGIKVTESAYVKFINPEDGKILSPGDGGIPVLIDKPELSDGEKEQQVEN
ncbi:TPA: hypothetical protein SIF69_004137, partial [Escherichia coli]|nr:hypothetical protein [Escherichia coli]